MKRRQAKKLLRNPRVINPGIRLQAAKKYLKFLSSRGDFGERIFYNLFREMILKKSIDLEDCNLAGILKLGSRNDRNSAQLSTVPAAIHLMKFRPSKSVRKQNLIEWNLDANR